MAFGLFGRAWEILKSIVRKRSGSGIECNTASGFGGGGYLAEHGPSGRGKEKEGIRYVTTQTCTGTMACGGECYQPCNRAGRAKNKGNGPSLRTEDEDTRYLAVTIYGEARGEPISGQIAVGQVIFRRAKMKGSTIREVVLKPYQFSCWNADDPNRAICEDILRNWHMKLETSEVFRQCYWVARGILDKMLLDTSRGATHYIARWLYLSEDCPDWAHQMEETAYVGNHIFLREV